MGIIVNIQTFIGKVVWLNMCVPINVGAHFLIKNIMSDIIKSYVADIMNLLTCGSDIPTKKVKYSKQEIEQRYYSFFNSPDFFYQLVAADGYSPDMVQVLYTDVLQNVQDQIERIVK